MLDIGGSIVALVTPFCDGSVDEDALRALVAWHIEQGTSGIVPVGTTGESPTLSHAEHKHVVEIVIDACGGAVPVIAGAGSNSTAEALEFCQHADAAGARAVLVVTPYYNKPTQAGLFEHFKVLNDAVSIPIIIYNIPSRSVVDMDVETMARLAKLPNIAGVKDATADVVRVSLQRRACGEDFVQLSGEDGSALGFIAHGGAGTISVTANVAPAQCAAFHEAALSGNLSRARALHDRLIPLHSALFLETSPAPVKYALARLGKIRDELRLPLVCVGASTRSAIDAALVAAGVGLP